MVFRSSGSGTEFLARGRPPSNFTMSAAQGKSVAYDYHAPITISDRYCFRRSFLSRPWFTMNREALKISEKTNGSASFR